MFLVTYFFTLYVFTLLLFVYIDAKLVKSFLLQKDASHNLWRFAIRSAARLQIGNDCANRERLRERLRNLSYISLFFLLQITLNFA